MLNTIRNRYWLPTIKAAIKLTEANSAGAVSQLESTLGYELADGYPLDPLYPAYVRGQAYLLSRDGVSAAVEFQKILDHRGLVGNSVIGALALLQLGRAYVLSGDRSKAKAAYQDFLTLWKDADPDIPILKEAKAQYTKLQ